MTKQSKQTKLTDKIQVTKFDPQNRIEVINLVSIHDTSRVVQTWVIEYKNGVMFHVRPIPKYGNTLYINLWMSDNSDSMLEALRKKIIPRVGSGYIKNIIIEDEALKLVIKELLEEKQFIDVVTSEDNTPNTLIYYNFNIKSLTTFMHEPTREQSYYIAEAF